MERRIYPVFLGVFSNDVVYDYLTKNICHLFALALGAYHVVHGREHGTVYYVEFVAVPLLGREQPGQVLVLEE